MSCGFAQRSLSRKFSKIRCVEPLLMTCRAPKEAVQGSDPPLKWLRSVTEPNHRTTNFWVSLPKHSSLERPCCRWVCSSPPWVISSAFSPVWSVSTRETALSQKYYISTSSFGISSCGKERQWKLSTCISALCDTPKQKKKEKKNSRLHSSNWAPNNQ